MTIAKLSKLFGIFVLAFLIVGSGVYAPSAQAAFQRNLIISDVVFNKSSSMSASSINTFLNQFPNSCISPNSGFQARIPSGYSPTGGFTYGGYGSAGEVIATAASVYGLNPQVVLVTLQKEQSLVTGSGSGYCSPGNDNNHKYAAAAGYGCPDGGTKYNYSGLDLYRRNGVTQTSVGPTCVNSAAKAGFSQQVIRAAWLLKFGQQRALGNTGWAVISGSWNNSDDPPTTYGGPMTQGNRARVHGGSVTYYTGYTNIDGSNVHIDSGATAALYWYTPHFHGNENFYSIFTSWFGSTIGSRWQPLKDPRIMATTKSTYKVNPDTGAQVQSIPSDTAIMFSTKTALSDGSGCLRTKHDTKYNANACIPYADLGAFTPTITDINPGGAISYRSSLKWTCKVDYMREKSTKQCFNASTVIAFQKKVAVPGVDYIITKHDADGGFGTAFRVDRFSQTPVWSPLVSPRIFVTNKPTYKINPATGEQIQSLSAGQTIRFQTKQGNCLRTEVDTTNNVNACVKISDLDELSSIVGNINGDGSVSKRSSLRWTCKIDYTTLEITNQCFNPSTTIAFQKKINVYGNTYIITRHDAEGELSTAFLADRFSS